MSSTTPLLGRQNNKDNLPIFLRVCHSPWIFINQHGLVMFRSAIAAYLLGSFIAILRYKLEYADEGWMILFQLPILSYAAQLAFYAMTTTWAYMHLYYPHDDETAWQRALSPPQHSSSSKKPALFSYFYSFVQAFPHVVTMLYWLIVVPHEEKLGGKGTVGIIASEHHIERLRDFTITNLYGVNSGIALFETLILSSIKRQSPASSHAVMLGFGTVAYSIWAYIGKWLVGEYAYYFLSQEKHTWVHFFSTEVSLIALTEILFAVNYGLTGLREKLANKDDDKNFGGYTRISQ